MGDIQVDLGPVQETLLIPLLGRAVETRKRRGLVRDAKAVEIVERLDYDFEKWKGPSLAGSCLRTRIFDERVAAFLERNPGGTVVEIGCGLNTRFERIDDGRARWFELDLPDVVALRSRFFAEEPRRTLLAASVLDDGWHEAVAATGGPWCFVSEAVLIYFDAPVVERVVRGLAARFPEAELLTDTTSTVMVDGQDRHDAMRKLPRESWFRWKCDDPATLESWGVQLEESVTFADASPAIRADLPTHYRVAMRVVPWILRRMTSGYAINRFRLAPRRAETG